MSSSNTDLPIAVPVSGVWLRRRLDGLRRPEHDIIEVLVQVDGQWRLCIEENSDGYYSHIAEVSSLLTGPIQT